MTRAGEVGYPRQRMRRASTVSWVLSLALLGQTFGPTLLAVRTAHAEVPITEEARQHFKAGVNLLSDPDGARYEEAYREFKAAYAASPSWKILGNLGLCAMKLERDGEAIDAYEKYLAEGGKDVDPAESSQIKTDLTTLKTGAAKLEIKVTPADATVTDTRIPVKGDKVMNLYQPANGVVSIRVRPGHHVVLVKADGFDPQTIEIDLTSAGAVTKEVVLKKPEVAPPPPKATPTTGRPVTTGVIVGGVATGVLFVGAGVVGVMALGKNSTYKNKNDGNDPTAAETLRSQGQTLNTVADILLAGGVVAAGVTIFLFVSRPTVTMPAKDGGLGVTVGVTPMVTTHGASLSLGGSF